MVANDTMAGAVITDLKQAELNGKVAVSGQDATAEGLQHIIDGDQCFTIYKPSVDEADPAVDADRPARQRPGARQTTQRDGHGPADQQARSRRSSPPRSRSPRPTWPQPINDEYTPKTQTCTGTYAALCTKAGVN